MHHLIYVSQASHPMSDQELASILEKSRDHNTRDGITGLLIYKEDENSGRANFMQLLEGDKQQLDDAFKRISADERHHTKVVLEEGEITGRHFPSWTMGFRNVDILELENFDGYSDLGSDGFWQRANSGELTDALAVMLSFYDG